MEMIKTLIKNFYKMFSLVWLFLGSALYFINNEALKKWYYYIILAILILLSIIIHFILKKSVKHKIQSIDVDIEIVCKDILSFSQGSIVIPTNDVFDTELGDIISINSIQGQFVQKVYNGNVKSLDSDIDKKLIPYNKFAIFEEEKKYGKNKCYPIGTIISIGENPKYLLTVVTKMDTQNEKAKKVTTDELWRILSSIWKYNRCKNSICELILPVIGTGFGRMSSNIITVLKAMLLSFYQESKEEKIADKLTIVVQSNKITRSSLFEIQEFLQTLN